MLTPDKIAAFNKITGQNVELDGSKPVLSRADQIRNIAKQATTAQAQPTQSQPTAPLSGNPVTKSIYDFAGGVDKSIGGTILGAADVGRKLANTAGNVPGLGFLKTPDNSPEATSLASAQKAMKPQNTAETAGKIIGDIGQFFIPGGAEKAAVGGLNATIDSLDLAKLADTLGPKAPNIIKGILKVAAQGTVTGASTAAVTAAQTGGDVGQTENAGIIGGLAGGTGKALEMIAPELSTALEKANFKLSPTKEAQLGQKAQEAASFISDNGIMGTNAGKAAKLDGITSQMESAIKSSIPDASVPRQELIDELNSIPDRFKGDPATYQKVKSDVSSAVATLKETQPKNVALDDILSSKRSYGKAAYNKDGSAMIKESKAAISNVFYDALDNEMKANDAKVQIPSEIQKYFGGATELPIKDFNATYSKAVKASQLTDAASNKKDLGLVMRLLIGTLGTAAGAAKGGVTGAIIGGATGIGLEEAGASGVTSALRTATGQGIKAAGSTIPAITKVGLGLQNQGD